MNRFAPGKLAEEFGRRDIIIWDGNYYALSDTKSREVEESTGMVRVHYNTMKEIERFGEVLGEIATGKFNRN